MKDKRLILVTGANGFVGSALCAALRRDGISVRGVMRSLHVYSGSPEVVKIDCLSAENDWTEALRDIQQVVHLAARVHVMSDKSPDPMAEFRRVNVEATAALARQAAAAGVKRFIYLSSIKVNGEFTKAEYHFRADDPPAPEDPYSVSKYEAEQVLHHIASDTGMEVVIIRPPLVYGPGVKANFESMMRWLKRGIPLPLGALTQNKRSMVALDNLVDLITVCLRHPAAANQIFLVSDGEELSTVDLLKRTAAALGVNTRLFFVPPILLKLLAKLCGKEALYQRLCGSLQIDMTKTQQLLHWNPPISIENGLRLAAIGDK